MATYNSPAVTNKVPATSHGLYGNVKTEIQTVTVTSAPTTSDTLNFFTIPKNSIIVGGFIAASQMDSNGSPTLTVNVGDAGSAGRLASALTTMGRSASGSVALLQAYNGVGYQYTADTVITAGFGTGPATGVAGGTVTLCVHYIPVGGPS